MIWGGKCCKNQGWRVRLIALIASVSLCFPTPLLGLRKTCFAQPIKEMLVVLCRLERVEPLRCPGNRIVGLESQDFAGLCSSLLKLAQLRGGRSQVKMARSQPWRP